MPRRKDTFWSHGEQVEDGRVACKYCSELFWGGITRLKYHLSGIQYGVRPCSNVPLHIKEMATKACRDLSEKSTKKKRLQTQVFPMGPFGSGGSSSSNPLLGSTISASSFVGSSGQRQATISSMSKKQKWDNIDKLLIRAIIMNNLPFNLVESNDFKNFVAAVVNYGPGYSLPSPTKFKDNQFQGSRSSRTNSNWVRGQPVDWAQPAQQLLSLTPNGEPTDGKKAKTHPPTTLLKATGHH